MLHSLIFGKQTAVIVINTNKRQELIIHFITSNEFKSHAISKERETKRKSQVTVLAVCNLNSFFSVQRTWQVPKKKDVCDHVIKD